MKRLIALVLLLAAPANAQQNLQDLADRAAQLEPSPPRYIQNLKFGVRGVTFLHMAVAPSSTKTMYATSWNGFIYASHDGGLTWTEGRLISERVKFFGAIRPSPAPADAGFKRNFPRDLVRNPRDSWTNPFADEILEDWQTADVGLDQGALSLSGTDMHLSDSGGAGHGGGDASRFGIGIVRGAPRLQALEAKRGYRLIGLNLKLLLNTRGLEATWVNHVAIHPTNPKIAFAATSMGLYRTTDGGLGWIDVFSGRSLAERWCHFVAFNPQDPSFIWLGTGQGLLFSDDDGIKFQRVTGTQLSDLTTLWLEFHPSDPKIIWAGSTNGAFLTRDGGRNWKWVFFETLPAANVIRGIAVDPKDPNRVQLATQDGMYRTPDGGVTWERSGGFLFTSQHVTRALADPRDSNHVISTTALQVWETFDWGDTWSAVYINDSDWSPRMLMFDPEEEGAFWVITSAEIVKLSSKPPPQPRAEALDELRARLAREPSLPAIMDASFRAAGVHIGEEGQLRSNARLSGLLPRVHAFAGLYEVDSSHAMFVTPFLLQNPEERYDGTGALRIGYWGAIAVWDLSNFLFHLEEPPFGRYFNQTNLFYLRIKFEVQRLYEERRRVLVRLITVPPDDFKALLSLRFRLEELTAHLNYLSGGLYEEQLRWLESSKWVD